MSSKWRVKLGIHVAHGFIKTNGELTPLSEEEDINYVIYLAESMRKKKELFKKIYERIGLVTRVHYPFFIKEFRGKYSLVFDPYKKSSINFKLPVIDSRFIESIVEELKMLDEKSFIDKLTLLDEALKAAVRGEKYVTFREYIVESLVMDKDVIEDIRRLASYPFEYSYPGVKLNFGNLDVEKQIRIVNELLDEATSLIGLSTRILGEITRIVNEWEKKIISKYKDQDSTISEKDSLINEARRRLESIRNNLLVYMDSIKSIEKQIMDLAIPKPGSGDNLYFIPLYVVSYMNEEGDIVRSVVIPPLVITPSSGFKQAKHEYFKALEKYFENLSSLPEDPIYESWILEYSLIHKLSIEGIKAGLSLLVNEGIVKQSEVEDVIKSIEEQLKDERFY
ncbi:MAG: hypothetical protein ABWW65_04425 [Thermoprotei archaeon]